MQTYHLVALTTLSSIFRSAVEKAYADQETFQQTLHQTTPAALLQEVLEMDARLNKNPDADPDFSKNYYVSVLAFNEKFMRAYSAIAGDDDLKALLPEGQGSTEQQIGFTSLGCPTLARLFAPRPAA